MSVIVEGKIFESDGLAWDVELSQHQTWRDWIAHPLCPTKRCRIQQDFTGGIRDITCFNCGRKLTISKDIEELRTEVNKKYQASKTWDIEAINLDLLPTKVTSIDKDEHFKIVAKLGQKDGKRTSVVYIIDRTEKNGEKSQFFIDVDDEMIRFDKDDKHPMKLLAKIEAKFLESTHVFEKNPRK